MFELRERLNLSYEDEEKYWREFWINKLGKWPDKIEKVAKRGTWKEKNEEAAIIDAEFKEFILKKLDK